MNTYPFKLIATNPKLKSSDGYYSLPQEVVEAKVQFRQTNEEQAAIKLSKLEDAGCFSAEVEEAAASSVFISSLRTQSLLAFNYTGIQTALEISNDHGNYCRFLGEHTQVTEAIKVDDHAARSCSYRCADLPNVGIVNAQLNDIDIPENYYDLIVISDVEAITKDQAALEILLVKVEKALSQKGILVLISQNPKPVSAWFNDGQKIPYEKLYGTQNNFLSQQQWSDLLVKTGLTEKKECCVLPNSQNPRTILSKDYIESNSGSINHFYSAGFVGDAKVNEYLLFSELSKTQNLYELCDSYLTITSKSKDVIKAFYSDDFSHFSSPGRRRQWRTLTNKSKNKDIVSKKLLISNDELENTYSKYKEISKLITQNLDVQKYQSGQLLVGLWLESLLAGDPDSSKSETFERYIKEYATWLKTNEKELAGQLYDILPFNIIVDATGDYQVIDPEWNVEQSITAEFVMFRALFWFGFHNRDLLGDLASSHGLFSLNDFVAFGLKLSGFNSDIEIFSQLESDIQSAIETQFNKEAIQETLRLPIGGQIGSEEDLPKPKAQIFFYNKDDGFDFENSVTLSTTKTSVAEKLRFPIQDLDLSRDTLRIDPVDRGGFFRISDINIKDSNEDVLCCLADANEIVSASSQNNAVFAESHLGSLFVAMNEDPYLVFDLNQITNGHSKNIIDATSLDLTLTYYGGIDYTLAMQQLGHVTAQQEQFIGTQRSVLETLKARYSELNDNFDFLKNNSEKQHALIEELTEREAKNEKYILEQQVLIRDQGNIISKQLEMMTRTFKTRVKLFAARILNKSSEPVEPEVVEEEVSVQNDPMIRSIGQNNDDYTLWIKKHELNHIEIARIKTQIDELPYKPVFSIVVPVYNIDEEYLMMAVDSVRNQLYPYWELCLVDDASPSSHIRPLLKRLAAMDERIVVKLNKQNQGIAGASNDALDMATGDYVGLLDHDDEISIDALYENAKVINENRAVDFIYSDEDKVTMQGERVDPFFKPNYSPDLLDSQNYICHFSVMSRRVLEKIKGFRLGYDGSQDHDIIIRAIENSEHVAHIPKILYHWRKVPGSTADIYDAKSYAWEAGRKAVASRLESSGEAGEVVLGPLQGTYRVKRDIIGLPKISIVIPFKDRPDLLEVCLNSIIDKSTYQNFEIIGVSNNSEEAETIKIMNEFQTNHSNIKFVEKNVPFNFSLLCNYGVAESTGDYVLLLNNDIEIQSPDWIELLLEHAQRPEVGAVGGKLFFPDGRIQHAGVVAGLYGAAGHTHLYFSGDSIGYYGGLMVTRNVSAVTGAMLMVSREKYDQVEGLDETNLAVAYNDVDLCLKLVDHGFRNVFTPYCHAIHYESASRGYEDNPEKLARLEKEKSHFVNKWQVFLDSGDPCFNPNFDLGQFDFSIKL